MYPIFLWSYRQLRERLDGLSSHGFHREAILACDQITVQLFKRLIRIKLTESSKVPSNGIRGGRLVNIISFEERDKLLSAINNATDLKKVWDSYARSFQHPNIQDLFDQCYEDRAWTCFSTKRKVMTHHGTELTYGVHYTAAKIGQNGYLNTDEDGLKHISAYAIQMVKQLLHPEEGIYSLLGMDLHDKTPSLKLKHSSLDAYKPKYNIQY